jgi:hypothetical protein
VSKANEPTMTKPQCIHRNHRVAVGFTTDWLLVGTVLTVDISTASSFGYYHTQGRIDFQDWGGSPHTGHKTCFPYSCC